MQIEKSRFDTKEKVREEIEVMNSFQSRATGTKGHQEFIAWMKDMLHTMGLETHSDHYTFDRWEETRKALFLNQEEIPIASAYPYSGETDQNGVTGELIRVKNGNYKNAKGKIAVVEISAKNKLPTNLFMNKQGAVPPEEKVVDGEGDLVLASVLKNPKLERAKENGVKAVILIWKGVSDAKVENQYLPFTDDYKGIPAIWLNETQGKKVLEAAQRQEEATVILEAVKQKAAPTESFYVQIEGKNKTESIIINSHTDGINVVEENGAVGMLSMIRYFQNTKPERTLIFAFVTGHFRLPVFKGTSQATSTWLQKNPQLWNGENGNLKAVAGLTLEHLGSMEWKDNASGVYEATGNIQTEYTYIGNKKMGEIWKKAIADRTTTRTVLLRGHNKFEFGESQPLFELKIPVIGLIPMPDYLMVSSPNGEMDKFQIELMMEQLESLIKALLIIDQTPVEELKTSDGYSYLFGKK